MTTYSELIYVLTRITNHDEAGRHFTEIVDSEDIDALEEEGWIKVSRPIHKPTGIPYLPEYWHVEVTEEGQHVINTDWDTSMV